MAQDIPVKVHQQSGFSLLRRPRPPRTLNTAPQPSSNRSDDSNTSPQKSSGDRKSAGSPYSTGSHHIDTHTKTDFPIHSLYPRGPSFFPRGRKLVGNHAIPFSQDNVAIEVHIPQTMDIDTSTETVNAHPIETTNTIITSPELMDYDAYEEMSEPDYYLEDDDFTLHDFQLSAEVSPRRRCENEGKVISRQNYLKLTGWFATNVPTQENLNTVNLVVGVQPPDERKPRRQALLELRSMVDEVLMSSATGPSSVTSEDDNGPVQDDQTVTHVQSPVSGYVDQVFRSSTSRYFCGQGRSNSPFDSSDQPNISPSEEAILDCMMSGGGYLSLKAHFITELPDLSPLSRTLTYLNISFNSLTVFPSGLLMLHHLVCLKMRNNPIKEIPNEIRNLTKLRVLCVSFNLLTDLPAGLFDLHSLCDLDVSYNTLHTISKKISRLVSLRKLNVEGNQLAGLPSTSSILPLTHLLVGDNLMHPILWRENTRNQPQELVDLCSTVVRKCATQVDDSRLSTQVTNMLQSHSSYCCDNCGQSVYGCGLRVIRAISQDVFGIKNLPFIFQVCSPSCRMVLKRKPNSEWANPFQTASNNSSHSPRIHNTLAIT